MYEYVVMVCTGQIDYLIRFLHRLEQQEEEAKQRCSKEVSFLCKSLKLDSSLLSIDDIKVIFIGMYRMIVLQSILGKV